MAAETGKGGGKLVVGGLVGRGLRGIRTVEGGLGEVYEVRHGVRFVAFVSRVVVDRLARTHMQTKAT